MTRPRSGPNRALDRARKQMTRPVTTASRLATSSKIRIRRRNRVSGGTNCRDGRPGMTGSMSSPVDPKQEAESSPGILASS